MRSNSFLSAILTLTLLAGTSCRTVGVTREVSGFAEVSPSVAHEMILDNAQLVVLDIRDGQSYSKQHIAGAISTPLESIEMRLPELLPYTSTTVLIYGGNNEESRRGARILVAAGFRNVVRIAGGLPRWIQRGYPTVGPG